MVHEIHEVEFGQWNLVSLKDRGGPRDSEEESRSMGAPPGQEKEISNPQWKMFDIGW